MRAVAAVAAALALLAVAAPTQVAAGYDAATAMTFLHLAGAAYCPQSSIWGWNGTVHTAAVPGFQVEAVLYEATSDTQAFVGYLPSQDAVVISYRGTVESSLKNWIEDLSAWKTKTNFPGCGGNCEVHSGFFDDYQGLQAAIHPKIEESVSRHPGSAIWITGHSLGAAMACLLATDLASVGHDIGKVYTFGQPRVGDPTFAEWVSSSVADEYFRVVHYHDIVPHLPPELLNFHHVPTEVWYNSEDSSTYQVCDGSGEDDSCSDSVALPDSISDHLKYLNFPIGSSTC